MKKIEKIINYITGHYLRTVWYKSIFVRTFLLVWGLIILTLLIFIVGTVPYQKKVLEERMKSEANDIAGSIGQVTASSIINNDYGTTVDHCLRIIKQSNSILYIIIVRKDGFSLVLSQNRWRMDNLTDDLNLPHNKNATSEFVFSKLVNQAVFHYSYPFGYAGIDWGRINVGLSLKRYSQDIADLYFRTAFLSLLSIIAGFFASIYFVRKLTMPILRMDDVSQQIALGDLTARVKIDSENELGSLAQSFNKMTESLKNSQDNLEKKVEERTAELGMINRVLQNEISEKLQAENKLKQSNSRLEALDKIYKEIISAKSVDEIITETISNAKNLFPLISKSAVVLFDFDDNIAKMFCTTFYDELQNKITIETIEGEDKFDVYKLSSKEYDYVVDDLSSIEEKSYFEKRLYDAGINSFITAPLIIDGKIIGVINIAALTSGAFNEDNMAVLLEVANQLAVAVYQAQLQVKINEHTKKLQNSLSEKEVLLKEIHHRVKNNLQVISSLLYLSSKKIKDNATREMFKDSQNRVKSIALVHERLYQSKDLGKIDFREYVSKLLNDLFRSYAVNQSIIKLSININNIFISIDTAVPCGLIINEIVSNSLKYAFPNSEETGKEYEININFNISKDKELILEISDNGIGLPEGLDIKKTNSLGLQLVDTLIDQLEGTMEIDRSSGTAFKFKFKDINT